MDLKPRCQDNVATLIRRGVDIPNPLTIDLGDEVDIDRISSKGVRIYPGCRIYGKETVISSGVRIGHEGPVTIEDCQLGPQVELKGGFFARSVFLEKANLGSGAQVREGCILEEEANGAHCVGIKQTILFPFVTLGSLINFCDCLMSGGTSRKHHSEVGSSYIHFNFTPEGDKTTASLIGDVPRGVMLNQPPIFLGGQGGIVGPIRMGFGNVVAANSVLRTDYPEDNNLIVGKPLAEKKVPYVPRAYPGLRRILEDNILYLANLMALEEWYRQVRRPFFGSQEFGPLVFAGLLDKLELAKKERVKRLQVLAEKVKGLSSRSGEPGPDAAFKNLLSEKFPELEALFASPLQDGVAFCLREEFLAAFEKTAPSGAGYIEAIQGLPGAVSERGTAWLQRLVDRFCEQAAGILSASQLFGG
ncbi:MAG: UDP-N-acetylglucosamine pyrophosphorylase [Deltaproteobacteria bacterium]|nr:UDP-N-acetylglucosamine pyrophosphorylase [Deltaproteobacteria bacterium]